MRGPRISYPHAVHHVINRFVDRHPFFQDPEDFEHFLEIYFEAARTFEMLTYCYCLMPNHFHFVLETPRGDMSRFLQRFLTKAAKTLNFEKNRKGHLFQGRSKTLVVQTDKYFSNVIAYVLLNPVRAGLSRDVFSYPWNSTEEMLREDYSRLDRKQLWGYLFGHGFIEEKPEESITEVRNWLIGIDPRKTQMEFEKGHRGGFLSNVEFRSEILSQIERRQQVGLKKGRRKSDHRIALWTWDEMTRAAMQALEQVGVIGGVWRSKEKAIQHVRWYLSHERACWTWDQIRQKEAMYGEQISKFPVAILRIKRNHEKMKIVELAEDIILGRSRK